MLSFRIHQNISKLSEKNQEENSDSNMRKETTCGIMGASKKNKAILN